MVITYHSKHDLLFRINILITTFSVLGFGPVTKTEKPVVMIAALNALRASGGGDYPEMAFSGLILALQNARPGSTCYLFTDATAKDTNKAGTAASLAKEKRIKVWFMQLISLHNFDVNKNSNKLRY